MPGQSLQKQDTKQSRFKGRKTDSSSDGPKAEGSSTVNRLSRVLHKVTDKAKKGSSHRQDTASSPDPRHTILPAHQHHVPVPAFASETGTGSVIVHTQLRESEHPPRKSGDDVTVEIKQEEVPIDLASLERRSPIVGDLGELERLAAESLVSLASGASSRSVGSGLSEGMHQMRGIETTPASEPNPLIDSSGSTNPRRSFSIQHTPSEHDYPDTTSSISTHGSRISRLPSTGPTHDRRRNSDNCGSSLAPQKHDVSSYVNVVPPGGVHQEPSRAIIPSGSASPLTVNVGPQQPTSTHAPAPPTQATASGSARSPPPQPSSTATQRGRTSVSSYKPSPRRQRLNLNLEGPPKKTVTTSILHYAAQIPGSAIKSVLRHLPSTSKQVPPVGADPSVREDTSAVRAHEGASQEDNASCLQGGGSEAARPTTPTPTPKASYRYYRKTDTGQFVCISPLKEGGVATNRECGKTSTTRADLKRHFLDVHYLYKFRYKCPVRGCQQNSQNLPSFVNSHIMPPPGMEVREWSELFRAHRELADFVNVESAEEGVDVFTYIRDNIRELLVQIRWGSVNNSAFGSEQPQAGPSGTKRGHSISPKKSQKRAKTDDAEEEVI